PIRAHAQDPEGPRSEEPSVDAPEDCSWWEVRSHGVWFCTAKASPLGGSRTHGQTWLSNRQRPIHTLYAPPRSLLRVDFEAKAGDRREARRAGPHPTAGYRFLLSDVRSQGDGLSSRWCGGRKTTGAVAPRRTGATIPRPPTGCQCAGQAGRAADLRPPAHGRRTPRRGPHHTPWPRCPRGLRAAAPATTWPEELPGVRAPRAS